MHRNSGMGISLSDTPTLYVYPRLLAGLDRSETDDRREGPDKKSRDPDSPDDERRQSFLAGRRRSLLLIGWLKKSVSPLRSIPNWSIS